MTILWAIALTAVALIAIASGVVVGLLIIYWVSGVDVIKVILSSPRRTIGKDDA